MGFHTSRLWNKLDYFSIGTIYRRRETFEILNLYEAPPSQSNGSYILGNPFSFQSYSIVVFFFFFVTMAVCFLTPIYTSSDKRPLISDHIKGPLVAAFRSPLMKALDRSVETLGLRIVTSSVTFIKSANQSSIKLCV